jgi:hypothetical protein
MMGKKIPVVCNVMTSRQYFLVHLTLKMRALRSFEAICNYSLNDKAAHPSGLESLEYIYLIFYFF